MIFAVTLADASDVTGFVFNFRYRWLSCIFRKQFVPDDYCWIQFIQKQFLSDFKGFKVFH